MENTEKKGIFSRVYNWFVNLTLKGLLQLILIAFIIIVILMSVSYLPAIISRVSGSLSAALYSVFVPAEGATMKADKIILNSGEDFTINFKKGELKDGLFTISYACNDNVRLTSIETNGIKNIECETSYYLLDDDTSITIRPTTAENLVRLNITGSFENNKNQKSETIGAVRITIKNASLDTVKAPVTVVATGTVSTSGSRPNSYVPSQPAPIQPVYYGKPDLAVRILQVGILTGSNLINSQTQFNYSDMVGIRFEIRNDGDAVTGPWAFTAALPSTSNPTFSSATQISLRPGESILFTLGFSNLTNLYSSLITINADPLNQVAESVEYNNQATQTITNLGYNSNYYNNYNNNNGSNNGCYINGIFTYNCLNNNYNNGGYYDAYGNYVYYNNYNNNGWNYNYYGNNLSASCFATPNDPETDDRVRWSANVSGGDGDYSYDWTGTNSLDSSSENPTKTYSSSGTKRATVTITDGDDNEVTTSCSVYVN